ncbi:unnamed protein product [Musa hybrid cultivar]
MPRTSCAKGTPHLLDIMRDGADGPHDVPLSILMERGAQHKSKDDVMFQLFSW